MSNFLVSYMPVILIGIASVIYAFRRYYASVAGRMVVDRIVLKLPVLGLLIRKIAVARFCRTLSTLMAAGVSILEALDITAKTAGNAVVEQAVYTTRKSIEGGETIAAPLRQTAVFPPMVVQMIGVGEATGALDTMLAKIADFYEDEVDIAVAGMLTLMEPIMIALLGGVVGGIVIAMYLPIFALIGQLTVRGLKLERSAKAGRQAQMDLKSRLVGLIAVRVVVGALVLGWATLVQRTQPGEFPVDPFFFLSAVIFGLSGV